MRSIPIHTNREMKMENTKTPEVARTEVSNKLPENAKLSDVISAVNRLIEIAPVKRDRGPDSEREMSEADAIEVIRGSLKGMKHGKAAEKLGLSYGQVYSARFGHTFKTISKETPWVKV